MQEEFIGNIHDLRERGAKRALLISATGTGKTYASAFALKNENPKKALFIVHRELIAKQAIKSYRKVFGKTKKLALLSGSSKEYDADILFATMSMMAKKETLDRYKKDEFDWICIDEVHRAGSESYQKIMSYFETDFWLGMTASPERTDGFDIFNLENNIPVNVDNLKLIGDYYKNDIYYTNTNSLVVADASNKFGVINFQGEEIIDCKYNNIISTINGNYIVQDEKDNYGIISVDGELVKPKYEMIIPFKNNYLMVRQGKMALFDNNYDNVTGFVLDYHEKEYDLHNSNTTEIASAVLRSSSIAFSNLATKSLTLVT